MHNGGNKDSGVEDSVDGGDKQLTHLSPAVDCCLKARSKQNACVDGNNGNCVDNSVDGGDKQLNHFTKAVDCCLKERSKQNACVNDNEED
eukprot:14817135-Ditylum_brightwellii.AAC.1